MTMLARLSSDVPWRTLLLAGAALAAGAAALDWLDALRVFHRLPGRLHAGLLAAGFLALGVAAGIRLTRGVPASPDTDAAIRHSLGISPRELEVLHALAEGLSTKEIARRLGVSPNTVKTHLARLFAKLSAGRRTEAIARARALGLLP